MPTDLTIRLRDEADLCRNETACDVAALLDEAADEIERLRPALHDLLTWFPAAPSQPEWRIPGGPHGADDAVKAARALLHLDDGGEV